jgi:type II secretory pathway pseudopilin PulG
MNRNKAAGGFTLLEMVLAVGILGTAMVVIIRGYTASVSGLEQTSEKAACFMLAENLLSRHEIEGEFPDGDTSGDFEGDFDGFSWKISAEPFSYEGVVFEGVLRVDIIVKGPGGGRADIMTFRENI